jgi:tetratricopeptide (TPR) repeat protein
MDEIVPLPSPQATLVILLGASAWPDEPAFSPSTAFSNAKNGMRSYFLEQFGLPPNNLLDLFDSTLRAQGIDEEVGEFLRERIKGELAPTPVRDVLIYYVGHGGISEDRSEFYLAIRRTRQENSVGSSIRIKDLAHTLMQGARFQRRILIFDCCFAGAAAKFLMSSGAAAVMREEVVAAFEEEKGDGYPSRGTSLLCSSDAKETSRYLEDQSSTIFTQALLHALGTGTPHQQERLSLRTIFDLTVDSLETTYHGQFPRPEIHSPGQSEGDVAKVKLFPNPAVEASHSVDRLSASASSGRSEPLRLDPADAPVHYQRGQARAEFKHYEEAIRDFSDAIRLDPTLAVAHYNRGLAKHRHGRYEEANWEYSEAIRLDPTSAGVYNLRGEVQGSLGRYEEAIADYSEAIRLVPTLAVAHYNRGLAKHRLGRYEEANWDYSVAIRLNPTFPMAYNLRGEVQGSLGRYEEAIRDFSDAIRLNPMLAVAHYNRGLARHWLGRYEEADRDYSVAIRRNSPVVAWRAVPAPMAYNLRGEVRSSLGRYEEAIRDFSDAIRLDPTLAVAHYNRGLVRHRLGRYEEANRDYSVAIRLNPTLAQIARK